MSDDTTKDLRGTIRVDEGQLQGHVDEVVRTSVEETLNAMLEAEADQLCKAQRYERADTRAGHYDRKLQTKAGDVTPEGPQAADVTVRDGDRRAVPAAGSVG